MNQGMGCGMLDVGCWMWDVRFRIAECGMLDVGCAISDCGLRIAECGMWDVRFRIADFGMWDFGLCNTYILHLTSNIKDLTSNIYYTARESASLVMWVKLS